MLSTHVHVNVQSVDSQKQNTVCAELIPKYWLDKSKKSKNSYTRIRCMRIIIMAGGTAKSFNRHSITIPRRKTCRQDCKVTKGKWSKRYLGNCCTKRHVSQYNEYVNTMKGNDLGCPLGCEELKGNVWLYGDVYYSRKCNKNNFKWNNKLLWTCKRKCFEKYGEFWAFKSDDTFWHWLKLVCKAFWDKKINRCWSWDLYAYHSGKWNLNHPSNVKQ